MTVEKWFLPEDHACQHAAQAPHVQTVVIHLQHRVEELTYLNRLKHETNPNISNVALHLFQNAYFFLTRLFCRLDVRNN